MIGSRRRDAERAITAAFLIATLSVFAAQAQPPDAASVIAKVDAAVKARVDSIASYTVIEHYSVYRGKDEKTAAAEMTVRTEYRKETGKTYTILSQSGSGFIVTHVLGAILDREKEINRPGIREHSWLISANYQMNLKPGGIDRKDGRDCAALTISPWHKAPNLIEGTIWVDARDGSIVRLEGVTSESPSIFTGASHLMRQYANVNGFAMATHARAVSDSFLLGRTIITIDYQNYQIQTAPSR
jgi:outer membrane lipoprotein-sorting protein